LVFAAESPSKSSFGGLFSWFSGSKKEEPVEKATFDENPSVR